MMDAKYLAEIRGRCELGRPAQQREVKALLAEVERQNQQIATLKKALMQAIREGHTDLSSTSHQKLFEHYVQAQEQEGKIG